jgi:adenylate cyclase
LVRELAALTGEAVTTAVRRAAEERLGLRGDLDEARAALAESPKLKPAMNSLARRRADVPWIANPPYWALQAKTLNVRLRRAGFPDE